MAVRFLVHPDQDETAQYCLNTTDYSYFGDLAEGTYYFKIADKRSNSPFDASYAVYH